MKQPGPTTSKSAPTALWIASTVGHDAQVGRADQTRTRALAAQPQFVAGHAGDALVFVQAIAGEELTVLDPVAVESHRAGATRAVASAVVINGARERPMVDDDYRTAVGLHVPATEDGARGAFAPDYGEHHHRTDHRRCSPDPDGERLFVHGQFSRTEYTRSHAGSNLRRVRSATTGGVTWNSGRVSMR